MSDIQIKVRLPENMRDRIRKRAEKNRRSVNSEIVYQLEQTLPAEETETAEAARTAPTAN